MPEPGAIYVMDRGYVDFGRLHTLHLASAFFVTQAKSNMDFHRVYSAKTDRDVGIICDQTIALDGFCTKQDYPTHLRRVRFNDPETGKTLVVVAIVKKRLDLDASLYTLLQILSVTLFEKMPLQQDFPVGDSSSDNATINNQLNL